MKITISDEALKSALKKVVVMTDEYRKLAEEIASWQPLPKSEIDRGIRNEK